MNKNIKTLLIDLGGVLLDLDKARCFSHFEALGLQNMANLLDVSHQEGFFLKHEEGLINGAAFREGIRSLAGLPLTDDEINEAWNSFLVGIPTYKLELLLQLRKQYKVYLLSNTNDIHWEWIRQHAFSYKGLQAEDFFDAIFLSFKMKVAKPNSEIFERVIQETGLNPAETFFIDDSAVNCKAANALGIATYTPKAHEDWSSLFK